ncbi:amino acid deaminase [Pseudoalteromonas sp. T1lg65]|uniref:amino acid deaminase n=1 Tax=Pseudoalteromonas sp. T1lg65 TaxID=2077101 RepID=UPI003F7A3283
MSEFFKGSGEVSQFACGGWSITQEQVSLPVAVLKRSALNNNIKWMSQYARQVGVKLAPHGKTTMAPALFRQQLSAGAWAISLATVPQVVNAVEHGVTRVILANQLVGKYHFERICKLLQSGKLEFYCFVDSLDNAKALGQFFETRNIKLNIFIEIGVENGRCGVRTLEQLTKLTEVCRNYRSLDVVGLSFYEGVISGQNAAADIHCFVEQVLEFTLKLQKADMFSIAKPMITGAGSAWYDIVSETFTTSDYAQRFDIVIRPGCYIIHDTGIYQHAQQQLEIRSKTARQINGSLESCLYVWAYVVSRPEPNLAIIGLGKRDAAFDAGLPKPELFYSVQNGLQSFISKSAQLTHIMDQHAMLTLANDTPLHVGDLVCLSTSHPCLTFDKWKQIGVVDDNWVIVDTFETYF